VSKYLCTCGVDFKKYNKAVEHAALYKDIDHIFPHRIMKRKLSARLFDVLLAGPWKVWLRTTGVWIMWQVSMHHFGVTFNCWESLLTGVAIGLICID